MKVLFSVGSFGFLRNFEPALRLLAERGHQVHLVADRRDRVGGTRTLELLVRDYPQQFRHSYAPSRKDWLWQPLATQLRLTLDYWRYLDPRYDHSPSLRARGASQAPPLASRLTRSPVMRSTPVLGALSWVVRTCERAIPLNERIEAFLRAEQPDLLLITPLLYFGSPQVDYVRAARRLGIRTALGVGSWDHLTTKGRIHERPDHVLVWNEAQRQEAGELHGIPADRVTVTGAQAYDHWFRQKPSLSREAFCAKVGVPADRPLFLYLCSSPFITPHEVPFVRRWIEAIRASADERLRSASILIRPHPQNAEQWRDFDPAAYDAVGIWPREGANPVDTDARADYYDSMFYSVAVVGVNTSALIESGIVGRPVYTILADEFAGQQEGTLHFQHLKNVNGGLLTVAASLDEHVAQLAGVLGRPAGRDDKSRTFIESFVRPFGFDVPAAGRFVDAIEAQVRRPAPVPVSAGGAGTLLRPVLRPLARLAAAARARRATAPSPARSGATRVLFVLASPEYLRYYDSSMRLMADRGYHVSVAVNSINEGKAARLDGLSDDRVEVLGVVPKRADVWTALARAGRGTFDFVRYLHPRLAAAPALRARMKRKVLPHWLAWLDRVPTLGERGLGRAFRTLSRLESAIPVSSRLTEFLTAHPHDVLVVSPLIDAASVQVDMVRAAQSIGMPVVAAIASWDNLTNKGHMRVRPDLVTVWNEHQKLEAVTYHGMPAARVAVTGAQLFDRWFEREPSQSRDAFCRMVGLPDDQPIILYTGSSVFIARSEVEEPFVRRWIEALRASGDPVLQRASILVRPHPFNCEAWATAEYPGLGNVAVWPRQRYTPAAETSRDSLFDSLFYSAAVVGVNTSAMIEAAILGRPVLSVLAPEFAATQEGTVHFHYLLPENGGFLRVSGSVEQSVRQLSDALAHPEDTAAQTARFVRSFIRPAGLDVPGTPAFVDAVRQVADRGPLTPVRDSLGSRVLRVALIPLALLLQGTGAGKKRKTVGRRLHDARVSTRKAVTRFVNRPLRLATRGAKQVSRGRRRVQKSVAGFLRVGSKQVRHRTKAVRRKLRELMP